MSLLRSSELRIVLDNSSISDLSEALRSLSDDDVEIAWASGTTKLYVGFKHQFNHRYVKVGAVSPVVPRIMTVAFWNGDSFQAFEDVIDETDGFSRSGFIVWEQKPRINSWKSAKRDEITALQGHSPVDGLYWVQFTLSDDVTVKLAAIRFLLSDDRFLQAIFPEVNQYLPTGQTDWLPQQELAKEAIVNRLKVDGKISYEAQIKNPEDWKMAASYETICFILAPIAGDERLSAVLKTFRAEASRYYNISKPTIDSDKSEVIDPEEDPDSAEVESSATTGWSTR